MTSATPITLGEPAGITAPLSEKRARTRAVRVGPLSFGGVVRSEWIKALSLRSVRWTALVSIVLGTGIAAMMAFGMRGMMDLTAASSSAELAGYLVTVAGAAASFLSLVFGVLGVFLFSSEYASGMILSSLTVAPRRGLFFAGKAAVVALLSAAIAVVAVVLATVIAVVVVPSSAGTLLSTQVVTGLLGSVFFLIAVALMAFGLAGLIRSTAGAITAVVALLWLIPMVLQIAFGVSGWAWLDQISVLLPISLGETASSGVLPVVAEYGGPAGFVPAYGAALGVLAAWAAVPVVVALKLFFVRDAR